MPEHLKAVGYIRVSTSAQIEGTSPDAQFDEIKNWVAYQSTRTPMQLVRVFEDLGISGASAERPAFQQLMEAARNREFNVVIVSRFSRFGRSLSVLVKALDDLKDLGIHFVSIAENYNSADSSSTSQLIRNILASLADWQRSQIMEQMYSGKLYRWQERKIWIGGVPFGYQFNKEAGVLEQIPEKIEIYKRIVGMYLDENQSYSQILENLRDQGVLCGKRPFSKPVLAILFKSTVYKGYYVANMYGYSEITRKRDGKRYRARDRNKLKPPEELIRWECEPAISVERWQSIQDRIELNRHKTRRRENMGIAWLRDRLKCAICGANIKPRAPGRRDKLPTTYQCYWSKAPVRELRAQGKKRCPLPPIDLEELHAHVWPYVVKRISPLGPNSQLARLISPTGTKTRTKNLRAELKTLQAQLTRKQNSVENLMAMLEMEGMTGNQRQKFVRDHATAENQVAALAAQVAAVEGELGNIVGRQEQAREAIAAISGDLAAVRRLALEIANASDADRYLIIQESLDEPIEIDRCAEPPGWEALHFSLRTFPTASIKKILDLTNHKADGKVNMQLKVKHLRLRCRPP